MDAASGLEAPQQILEAEVKAFFDSAPPLQNIARISEKLKAFIERHSSSSGRSPLTTLTLVFYELCLVSD